MPENKYSFQLEPSQQNASEQRVMGTLDREFFGLNIKNVDAIGWVCRCRIKNLFFPASRQGQIFQSCNCGIEYLIKWNKYVEYKDEESDDFEPYDLHIFDTTNGYVMPKRWRAFMTKEGDVQPWQQILK